MQSNVYYGLVKNNPAWFLKHCRFGGFEFSIENGRLAVTPAQAIDDEMAQLIRLHKVELLKILSETPKELISV